MFEQLVFALSYLLMLPHFTYSKTLPPKILGFYLTIADDSVNGYGTNSTWQPSLYPYQIDGSNVLWLAFINPQEMKIPDAMINLAKCRGSPGCPTDNQLIIPSVGGQLYSEKDWPFLESSSAAEAMAQEVSTWDTQYGFDGIDLDIEGSAGGDNAATSNIIVFAQKLKSLNPSFIITFPVYGYPQINAEISMVNSAWTTNGKSNGIVDSLGIMVYSDDESLQWVKDYANATSEWDGFPITVDVPMESIIVGLQGSATGSVINEMVNDVLSEGLGGLMVWFASVFDETTGQHAYGYGADDATPQMNKTGSAWVEALKKFSG